MTREIDFLIIGSGVAGLSLALKLAEHRKVLLVTKGEISEGNTEHAQGGICSVTYLPDSFEQHIRDTMVCGSFENDEQVVRMVVENAPLQIQELIHWGVRFDKRNGKYDLAREGGHTQHRILHHKDSTGREIEQTLVRRVKAHRNIEVLEHHFAVDLLTQHHLGELVKKSTKNIKCFGAYILNLKTNKVFACLAKMTILATGGVGNIYQTTTNPSVATGDGIAMVHRAKGVIEGMEFIQFHPTSLFNPSERPSFLISEALRGYGAVLRNRKREEFMHRYHEMGSLAPRDVVARAMDTELKISGEDYLYLDVTFMPAKETMDHFPNIYKKCLSLGIDITKDMIPVVPAAHYCCGGIDVDMDGQTSIEHLFAAGECASTGLHGANRLASNSLIEAVVYSDRIAKYVLRNIENIEFERRIPAWDYEGTSMPEEMVLITQSYKEMQQIMSNYVGIVRSNVRLERAFNRMSLIYKETEIMYKTLTLSQPLCELRNMIAVGYIIIKQAIEMKQSVGLHYTLDYPMDSANNREF